MAKLTANQRHGLSASQFALPGGRYPIEDASHARNALARGAQHASPAELAKIKAAVRSKYPSIEVGGKPAKGYADGGKVESGSGTIHNNTTGATIQVGKPDVTPGSGVFSNSRTGVVTKVGKVAEDRKYASGGMVLAASDAMQRVAGAMGAEKAKTIQRADDMQKPPEHEQAGGHSKRADAIEEAEQRALGRTTAKYAKGGPVQGHLRMAPPHKTPSTNIHGMPIYGDQAMSMNQARRARG